jgi:hypothetical protein
MIDDRADDPVGVVRDVLANGPVSPAEFKRLTHERGVSVKLLPKAAGARCVRTGGIGQGSWAWVLSVPIDHFITTKPRRKGYYANNLFVRGKEVQCKLADDLEAARELARELVQQTEARKAAMPVLPRGRLGGPRPKPLPERLRDLARKCLDRQQRDIARELLKLCRAARALEAAAARTDTPRDSP